MDVKEQYAILLNEIIEGIDQGDFSGEMIPEKYTYQHLYALFMFLDLLDGGKELYEQIYDLAVKCGMENIRRKSDVDEKIKIVFIAISAAEWASEQIYRRLKADDRIECYVVVSPMLDRDLERRREAYRQTIEFFTNNGYDVRGSANQEFNGCTSWEELGGIPDIVIRTTTWDWLLAEEYRIVNLPLQCMNCYIPYGMYTVDSTDGSYVKKYVYNKEIVNMMWRIYIDSPKNLEGYQEYSLLHGKNVRYSGYVKMDYFYNGKEWNETEIKKLWKIPKGIEHKDIKKVIIAPHHAIEGHAGIKFSTFTENAYFLLQLAQKYCNKVSFIFKPHPNLGVRAVEAGFFESYEAYDAYLEQWNLLPNAKVVQEDDYLRYFDTSDGMIMDSASFIGEYMYADKPLLFLRREGQAFNRLGQRLLEADYLVGGNDYSGIEKFLCDVILDNKDILKPLRHEIFKQELDYVEKNKCFASEYIYRDIVSLLM